jgi:hypothetical protein
MFFHLARRKCLHQEVVSAGAAFARFWKSRHLVGRPVVPLEVRALIRTMSQANPLWAPGGFTASC